MERTREEWITKLRRIRGLIVMGWCETHERWDEIYGVVGPLWKRALERACWFQEQAGPDAVESWKAAEAEFHAATESVLFGLESTGEVLCASARRLLVERGVGEGGHELDGQV